jgi:hypothetical protein
MGEGNHAWIPSPVIHIIPYLQRYYLIKMYRNFLFKKQVLQEANRRKNR